jgi:uncharacterized protein
MNDIIAKIKPVLKKYHIKKASLFGSYARGEEKKGSDIDLLIQTPENMTGYDYFGIRIDIQEELERILDKKVDVVDYKTIKPALKKYILPDQVAIFS